MPRTPYRVGLIRVQLTKPETAATQKTLDLVTALSKMQPVAKPLSEAATAAAEALINIIKLAGCDAVETLPLFEKETA